MNLSVIYMPKCMLSMLMYKILPELLVRFKKLVIRLVNFFTKYCVQLACTVSFNALHESHKAEKKYLLSGIQCKENVSQPVH